jgi:3-dehydroquinate dehydratase
LPKSWTPRASTRVRKAREVVPFQSNHEGDLIDWFQAQAPQAAAIVVTGKGLAARTDNPPR